MASKTSVRQPFVCYSSGVAAIIDSAPSKQRSPARGRPCVFFDRDGIVNRRPIKRYVETLAAFDLLPEFVDALRVVRQRGYAAVVVTNQRGVEVGCLTRATLAAIHRKLRRELRLQGLTLDAIRVCTSLSDRHPDRKPNPGMLLKAARQLDLDVSRSWMVGDQETDVEAGRRAGCRTVLVSAEADTTAADAHLRSMAELPAWFRRRLRPVRGPSSLGKSRAVCYDANEGA